MSRTNTILRMAFNGGLLVRLELFPPPGETGSVGKLFGNVYPTGQSINDSLEWCLSIPGASLGKYFFTEADVKSIREEPRLPPADLILYIQRN